MTDPYLILGVSPIASTAEIRAAYRRAANEAHPDHHWNGRQPDGVGDDAGATERMAALNEAWRILCDAERRASYDLSRVRVQRLGQRHVVRVAAPDPTDLRHFHQDHVRLLVMAMIFGTIVLTVMVAIAMAQSGGY